MNRIRNEAARIKYHVTTHKFAYVASVAAIAAAALQQRNIRQFNEFLDEKGIDKDEFYNPEFYAEKQAAKELAA